MCDDRENKGFMTGVVLGGLLGAGLFFLFGTEKGKKVQKELKEKGKEAAEDLQGLLVDLEEKGNDFKEKAEEVAQEVKKKVEETIEDKSEVIKEQMGKEVDTTMTKIEKMQEHGREVTESIHDDLKKRFFKNIPSKN